MSRDLIFDIRMAPHKKKRRLVTEYPVIYTKLASSNWMFIPKHGKHMQTSWFTDMYLYTYIYYNYPLVI